MTMISIEQYQTKQDEAGRHFITETKAVVNMGRLIDPDAEDYDLDWLSTLQIEYVRLPQPQVRLEMPGGNDGIFAWTDTFSLILMIYDAGFWAAESKDFEQTPLGKGLLALNTMQLGIVSGKT